MSADAKGESTVELSEPLLVGREVSETSDCAENWRARKDSEGSSWVKLVKMVGMGCLTSAKRGAKQAAAMAGRVEHGGAGALSPGRQT